jgi:hypothetical protein
MEGRKLSKIIKSCETCPYAKPYVDGIIECSHELFSAENFVIEDIKKIKEECPLPKIEVYESIFKESNK